MQQIEYPTVGTYVIAVSGGVDSVVLLDVLAKKSELKLIVAHFDHGIRPESSEDATFVAQLAAQYGLECHSEKGNLGAGADEATARAARYGFLYRIRGETSADAILTAHHQDDVIETMLINLMRGTGWKGLCSLRNTDDIKRPLLGVGKTELREYAQNRQLVWHEDSTNQTDQYLRNRVRRYLAPRLERSVWIELYHKQLELLQAIDRETNNLATDSRYFMIMTPQEVAIELLRAQVSMTRPQAQRALHYIKSGKPGTTYDVGGGGKIELTASRYIFHPAP